jgi:hypothetical protein
VDKNISSQTFSSGKIFLFQISLCALMHPSDLEFADENDKKTVS